ncbi:MAG: ribulokinase [Phycisphaerales bacterium]
MLGLDLGTSEVRALLVDAQTGRALGTAASGFEHGDDGVITSPLDPHLARQHPADYIAALPLAVNAAMQAAARDHGVSPRDVRAIGVDATGSTPIPVDRTNTPLGMLPRYANAAEPDALAWLWKDHTAHAEAAEIGALAAAQGRPYLSKCGGVYSSEWFWSKILRCHRVNPPVAAAAHAWVEQSDWIPSLLCGVTDPLKIKRGICAAGHKGLYHESWGGLPEASFLRELHPDLPRARETFAGPAVASDTLVGSLAPHVAARLGLPVGVPVAAGAIDAHMGAVGSGCAPGTLVKIIGTSTCDCIAAPIVPGVDFPDIPGVCGIVPGSILPGHYGIEAGQSAVGDIFNWFVSKQLGRSGSHAATTHARLTADASRLVPGESGLLTLDWHNGNRTVLVDPRLTGLTLGQTLATTPAEMYRSLIEATALGARMIVERLGEHGVRIDRVVCCGGIAEKNPLLMQIYADVLGMPMHIAASDQACALGAAVMASVAVGIHPDAIAAQRAMTGVKPLAYQPTPAAKATYDRLFALYRIMHDAMGLGRAAGIGEVMKELLRIQSHCRRRAGPQP